MKDMRFLFNLYKKGCTSATANRTHRESPRAREHERTRARASVLKQPPAVHSGSRALVISCSRALFSASLDKRFRRLRFAPGECDFDFLLFSLTEREAVICRHARDIVAGNEIEMHDFVAIVETGKAGGNENAPSFERKCTNQVTRVERNFVDDQIADFSKLAIVRRAHWPPSRIGVVFTNAILTVFAHFRELNMGLDSRRLIHALYQVQRTCLTRLPL
jgi:hypothetical protein